MPKNPDARLFACSCVKLVKNIPMLCASTSDIVVVLMVARSCFIWIVKVGIGNEITSLTQVRSYAVERLFDKNKE